jgi:Spy/CpxP family protein refolding chaperone
MMIAFFAFPRQTDDSFRKFRKDKFRDHKECLMKDLQLSDEQEKKFFELRDNHKTVLKEKFSTVKTERNNMIDAIAKEPALEPHELYIYAETIGNLEYEIQKETIDYFLKMKMLLNHEQFSKLINSFRDVCGCPHHQKLKKKHYKRTKSYHNDSCPPSERNNRK